MEAAKGNRYGHRDAARPLSESDHYEIFLTTNFRNRLNAL